MSQPLKGGATVYTDLHTGVWPSKNDGERRQKVWRDQVAFDFSRILVQLEARRLVEKKMANSTAIFAFTLILKVST